MSVHPRDRLKRKRKIKLENHDNLTKKSKGSDIAFFRQVPLHPRERLKRLDISMVDEETIIDKIIEGLNDPYLENDKYWIEHEPGSNYFTVRLEDGKKNYCKKPEIYLLN